MKEVQPAGRCFFSYGLGFSICDMGPHQVGVVKGLCPFKAQDLPWEAGEGAKGENPSLPENGRVEGEGKGEHEMRKEGS